MKRNWIVACTTIVIAARVWVVGAIGWSLSIAAPVMAQAPDQEGFEPWVTMVDEAPIAEALADRSRGAAVVERLLGNADQEFVRELLASLRQGVAFRGDVRGVPSALGGIAGSVVIPFLEAYANNTAAPEISGRIKDYVFDQADLSGHLAVETRVEHPPSETHPLGLIERFHWDIEVLPGTYQVIPHSGDRDDPFPDTVAFDPAKLNDIERRRLDHKLFAQGPGIRVRHVYQILDDDSIQRLHNNHPYYASTLDSCIDLMFAGPPPAIRLPPQPGYCLGRCAQPAVVNSN
jgi:hypothetical protein